VEEGYQEDESKEESMNIVKLFVSISPEKHRKPAMRFENAVAMELEA
jgi:hypothetical protein